MPVFTNADLVAVLRELRLLEAAHLDELRRGLQTQFTEPRLLARELVKRGWLTTYQVNELFQGRGQELLLGSYLLLDKLGEGGMGAVFKARNWKLGQVVALKLIRKERLTSADAVRRFQREIRAAAQLNHPHIVQALDADEVNGTHFFVMEFVAGLPLNALVKQRGPLPVVEACDYIRQAALGLQHAFERGLVHRDIKPHNLLLTRGGVVKVLDMGLARTVPLAGEESSTLTLEGAIMGTPDYIAPEQARDAHRADIRADLYSLGCTLYYLLTGQVPFPGGSLSEKLLNHQMTEPNPVEQLRFDLPPAVGDIVRQLMAKRPEARFQTPAELVAALTRWGESSSPPVVSPESDATTVAERPPDRPARRKTAPRRRWLAAAGVTVSVVLLAALLLWIFGPFHSPGPSPQGQKPPATTPVEPLKDTNSLGMRFVLVPKGSFWMGGGGGQPGDRQVEIKQDFYLGVHEMTQQQWQALLGNNPSHFSRTGGGNDTVKDIAEAELKQFPVESVSWDEVQEFIRKLNAREKDTGWVYRLPTEAEWEYACRGGATSKEDCSFDFYFERPTNDLSSQEANFDGNSPAGKAARGPYLARTAKVGSYQPNRLGIFDMHGNVWEWCDDLWDGGPHRVVRSGCWRYVAGGCTAAYRDGRVPATRDYALGVRLVRVPSGKES